jgi:CRISPR type I-E-associated protein CasB/Cse2
MTPNSEAARSADTESNAARPPLATLVGRLVHDIREVLPPGDIAELRRLRPGDMGGAAYWKLMTSQVDSGDPSDRRSDSQDRKWATILASLARLAPFHRPRAHLGRALAEARVAEPRLLRLLRARGEQLEDAVRVLTHQIASTGTPVDCTDLAWLVLSEGGPDEVRPRRRVARDYYSSTPRT